MILLLFISHSINTYQQNHLNRLEVLDLKVKVDVNSGITSTVSTVEDIFVVLDSAVQTTTQTHSLTEKRKEETSVRTHYCHNLYI